MKQQLRALAQEIRAKRYLNDNDSDINEFESVSSRKVRNYRDHYTAIIKKDEL